MSHMMYINGRQNRVRKHEQKLIQAKRVCRYVQPKREEDGSIKTENRGIIPRILQSLLDQRKRRVSELNTKL